MGPRARGARKYLWRAARGAAVQARDAVILAVGALVVVGATVYAGVGGATQAYAIAYPAFDVKTPAFTLPFPAGNVGGYSNSMNFGTPNNVSRVVASFNVTPRVASSGLTAHVTLRSPNGTTIEKESSSPPGGGALNVRIDLTLQQIPLSKIVMASSEAEARALVEPGVPGASGDWQVNVSVASTTPGPAAAPYDLDGFVAYTVWTPVVAPLVAASQK